MSRTIPLTAGRVTIVDDEDYEWLNQWKWWFSPLRTNKEDGYAGRKSPMVDGKRTTIMMHRLIAGAPKGAQVDHENGNKLDNRRSNLRIATHGQNSSNKKKFSSRRAGHAYSSGFKGVSWNKKYGMWYAHISVKGKSKHLGRFNEETQAARAYDLAAAELYGEFALLNFPLRSETAART